MSRGEPMTDSRSDQADSPDGDRYTCNLERGYVSSPGQDRAARSKR
jgi:hypothetical protein